MISIAYEYIFEKIIIGLGLVSTYKLSFNWVINGSLLAGSILLAVICRVSFDVINNNNSPHLKPQFVVIGGALILFVVIFCALLINNELQNRKISTYVSGLGQSNKSASVLDSLPDGIIIADNKQISYLNQEAWRLLGCQSTQDEYTNIEDVYCHDSKNCSILTPLDQLINFLCAVENHIANINKETFLTEMIQLATDDVMLLHMHQGLASPCNVDESEGTEGKET